MWKEAECYSSYTRCAKSAISYIGLFIAMARLTNLGRSSELVVCFKSTPSFHIIRDQTDEHILCLKCIPTGCRTIA